jgi:uncharacterized protein (DUF2062 family)
VDRSRTRPDAPEAPHGHDRSIVRDPRGAGPRQYGTTEWPIGPRRYGTTEWRRRASDVWRSLRGVSSPVRLGVSVGVGLFIGSLPLYGLHMWLCLAVCLPLRLDSVAACLASNVSNPFVAPFLILAEVELGSYLLHGVPASFDLSQARLRGITGLLYEAALGGVMIGALLGVVGGLSVALLARQARRRPTHPPPAG